MSEINYKNITFSLIDSFNEAGEASLYIQKNNLKVSIKEDDSPVSNGDLKVNEILTKKINELTPDIPIVSEETVNLREKNIKKTYWLIDPIDGTKEYIAGKDEFTLNAALIINKKPVIGLVGVPKKTVYFILLVQTKAFLLKITTQKKLNVKN